MAFVRRVDGNVVEIALTEQPDNRGEGDWQEEPGSVESLIQQYFPDPDPE